MSDFLISTKQNASTSLTAALKPIMANYSLRYYEYEGEWGSLAVSETRYHGFQPYESGSHICVVLGGPALYFADLNVRVGDDSNRGTQLLLERYLSGQLDFENDVSGPFAMLVVDKETNRIFVITDLMMFIALYRHGGGSEPLTIGSHVDALARATKCEGQLDKVSIADFILHGVVTYPYTVFREIRQLQPATDYAFDFSVGIARESKPTQYWLPEETCAYDNLANAAIDLRAGVQKYIGNIAKEASKVAQFISGGEDSRVLSGLLPEKPKRDAYIFLDSMNREGKIAEKVAKVYGVNFKPDFRDPLHYLDILEEASELVGSGHQYLHSHSLVFDRKHNLAEYDAVFGGYSSDVFLKGHYVQKSKLATRLKFIPEKFMPDETQSKPLTPDIFPADILAELTKRRQQHVARVKNFRTHTVHEWFLLWPATMRKTMPNLYCNRRLFASYEPFMSHEVVKLSATIPTEWKLNRRLFHRAFKGDLKKSKWIIHSDLRYPYLDYKVGGIVQFALKLLTKIMQTKKTDGAWTDFKKLEAKIDTQVINIAVGSIFEMKDKPIFRISKVGNARNTLATLSLLKNKNIKMKKSGL